MYSGRRLCALLLASLTLIGAAACSGAGYQGPTDPSGVGLKAFCGVEDALAASKADWAVMTSQESQIEDVLGAADRLERSYALASQSLGSVPGGNPVYESAQYIKAINERLSTVFGNFKEAYASQDQSLIAAAKEEYTTAYNSLISAYTNGKIPGVNAFNVIVGNMESTCVGITTSFAPADSSTAVKSDENSTVCQSATGSYSVNQFFSDVIALDLGSFQYSGPSSLQPLKDVALKLQPLTMQSSGPLLIGLAKISSGWLTAYEAASLGNADAFTESLAVAQEGITLAGQSCLDIGIVFEK
jgi:hypothetical protein